MIMSFKNFIIFLIMSLQKKSKIMLKYLEECVHYDIATYFIFGSYFLAVKMLAQ